MPSNELVTGRQRTWSLLQKLGEGDAGEVYRVESLIDHKIAILKRPRRTSFPSETIRQASQIEKESIALGALSRINQTKAPVSAPILLDQSKPGTEFSERFFIVITPAAGFDLGFLARTARFASVEWDTRESNGTTLDLTVERSFLESVARSGKLPDLITLRCLAGLIEYLETIHTLQIDTPTGRAYGILWNDVKPEHCYWDPAQTRFTIIDWGNAQFLETDGATKDRQFSRMGDYQQFLAAMGRFLADFAADLYQRLDWPETISPGNVYSAGILPLKERVNEIFQNELLALRQIRRAETDLVHSATVSIDRLLELAPIHQQIMAAGELPDQEGADQYFHSLAQNLVTDNDLSQFRQLCQIVDRLPARSIQNCALLQKVADIVEAEGISRDALLAGLNGDWEAALWDLRTNCLRQPEPAWWDEVSEAIRKDAIGRDAIRPWVAINRLVHALQSAPATDQAACDDLIQTLKSEVLLRWRQLEPDPPDADIEYREIDRISDAFTVCLPESVQALNLSLEQPRAQINIALDAWKRRDFDTTRRALRRALFWDPDRTRLIQADRAIHRTTDWLAEIFAGLVQDESLQDFVTRLELAGREIRSQVGPAAWLDTLLDAFKQLRKGIEPTDVLVQYPEAREYLGWLITLEPRRPLLSTPGKSVRLERQTEEQHIRPTLYGVKEAIIGQVRGAISLSDSLDTWSPEARGSSARLFSGLLPIPAGEGQPAAIKLMRPDRAEYALPLFREEARILSLLRDVPGVVPLIECGFMRFDHNSLPPEERSASAANLTGEAVRYGQDSVHNFLADLDKRVANNWLPYLAIEKKEHKDNLLLHCDISYTHGRYMPILEGLVMAIQICNILEAAHSRNIVYRDHKILHYYWQEDYNGIFMIDWNVAKRYPEGLSDAETQFDLVQLGARTLHTIFAGRAAPGALPLGPNRPEEIEAASHSYTVQWTYDDQRLPKDIKDLLEAVLTGAYISARPLRDDLQSIYTKLAELAR